MAHKDPQARKEYQKQYRIKHKERLDAYKKEWNIENPDKAKKHQKDYALKNTDKRASWQRLYRYGLTDGMFSEMIEDQNNECKICSRSFEETKIFVDHCHDTGSVRGLLCPSCNTALGLIKDDLRWLHKAKIYLTGNP